MEYFSKKNIQNNLRIKFGNQTVDHINKMTQVKLKRKILDD